MSFNHVRQTARSQEGGRMNRRLLWLVWLAMVGMLMIFSLPVRATQTLEKSQEWVANWNTVANGVYAADVDGDGTVEILTIGSAVTGTGLPQPTQAQLRIWNWNGITL